MKQSGLLMDNDSVGILSGTDEGVFGWFTLNYLTRRIRFLKENGRLLIGVTRIIPDFSPKNCSCVGLGRRIDSDHFCAKRLQHRFQRKNHARDFRPYIAGFRQQDSALHPQASVNIRF
jgi:hypothetical protein